MPNPNRKTLLRALCLTAAGSALFASLHVGSTSAYFTSTATVQVADIQAGTWSNNAGQSDASEADSPVFLDEDPAGRRAGPRRTDRRGTCGHAVPHGRTDCNAGTYRRADTHPGGHRLKGTIQLADGAALTVHGKGMIQATARSHSRAGCPIYARGQGCRVDLYGGRYLGGAGSCAVCAAAGQVILHGGLYAVKGDSADHLLYSVGDGAITVEGGRFVGFDPAACLAPGRTTAAQETDKGILYVVKEL